MTSEIYLLFLSAIFVRRDLDVVKDKTTFFTFIYSFGHSQGAGLTGDCEVEIVTCLEVRGGCRVGATGERREVR